LRGVNFSVRPERALKNAVPIIADDQAPAGDERKVPMTNDVQVDVRRSGRRFEAEAVLDLAADLPTVWSTITDYGALASFMPGIRACRVIERHARPAGAEHLVVEQQGEFRFLLFAQTMKVLLNIEHEGQHMAQAKAISFDLGLFKRSVIDVFEGRYELTPLNTRGQAPRTHLRYTSLIGLLLPPPPAIGNLAIRQNLQAQLEAVAQEITRRSARTAAASAAATTTSR
jgi:hypothetical protein